MIFHASIPADDPERVARVIAELWRTDYFPFVVPGAFIVIPDDERGTEIEVFNRKYEGFPATDQVGFRNNPNPTPYGCVHLAIAIRRDVDEVMKIAEREGWIARICDRQTFNLVEFWVENKFLLELLPDEEVPRYQAATSRAGWRALLAEAPRPPPGMIAPGT